jgi:amidophosphoribosyltransferase
MCGIYGIYAPGQSVSKLVYLGLYALQHRGQESAGISVSQSSHIKTLKKMGLVSQVFNEEALKSLDGDMSLGHVRYSTTGHSHVENAQPVEFKLYGHDAVLGHNGNLVNYLNLKNELEAEGYTFSMSSDTEVIAALLQKISKTEPDLEKNIMQVCGRLQGAFSLVLMTQHKLFAMRDPHGIRPLSIGRFGKNFVLSSETAAMDIIGAEFMREVERGELVVIDEAGLRSQIYNNEERSALCVFEHIYFARPDSNLGGRNVYEARIKLGQQLFHEHPAQADIVIAVPDSGIPAAIGFSRESGIPYVDGMIKNRYVGRTFIQPDQMIRELGVRIKLNPLRHILDGKKVVIVDDSIVRGTTSRQIVKLIREGGAREVHFRISAPPIFNPCFYGIDTAVKGDLIASHMSSEEIRNHLGADSLGYLSVPGLLKALNSPQKEFCLACFNSDYPVKVPEEMGKLKLEFNLKEMH